MTIRSLIAGVLLYAALVPPVLIALTVLFIAVRGGDIGPNGEILQLVFVLIGVAALTMICIMVAVAIWAWLTRERRRN